MRTTTRIRPTKLGYAVFITMGSLMAQLFITAIIPAPRVQLQDTACKVQKTVEVVVVEQDDEFVAQVNRLKEDPENQK